MLDWLQWTASCQRAPAGLAHPLEPNRASLLFTAQTGRDGCLVSRLVGAAAGQNTKVLPPDELGFDPLADPLGIVPATVIEASITIDGFTMARFSY